MLRYSNVDTCFTTRDVTHKTTHAFQQNALLRIHTGGLRRTHRKCCSIEEGDVCKECRKAPCHTSRSDVNIIDIASLEGRRCHRVVARSKTQIREARVHSRNPDRRRWRECRCCDLCM